MVVQFSNTGCQQVCHSPVLKLSPTAIHTGHPKPTTKAAKPRGKSAAHTMYKFERPAILKQSLGTEKTPRRRKNVVCCSTPASAVSSARPTPPQLTPVTAERTERMG
ncbi:hypothetical protein BaRGS_00035817 [Batillaria attramentaria]|uniref:Uncharacterized protein n=1 Tax=Batillaria attramentaria TaxID=370345 RepID=A0ABD0JED9_9CAEN